MVVRGADIEWNCAVEWLHGQLVEFFAHEAYVLEVAGSEELSLVSVVLHIHS